MWMVPFLSFPADLWQGLNTPIQDASHDPFLLVQPSLDDSVLVKQGMVEETALPPAVHSGYDIQVGSFFRASPYQNP